MNLLKSSRIKPFLFAVFCLAGVHGQVFADAQTYYEQALTAFENGEQEEAYIHLKNVLQRKPGHLPGKILMGKLLVQRTLFEEGLTEFAESLRAGADINQFLSSYTHALIQTRQFQRLTRISDSALSTSNQVKLLLAKSVAFTRIKKPQKTLESLLAAQTLAPLDSGVLNALTEYHIRMKALEKAESNSQLALAHYPDNTRAWHLKGQILKASNQIESAMDAFNKSLALEPENKLSQRALSMMHFSQGNYLEATRLIDSLLKDAPEDPHALLLKSRMLLLGSKDHNASELLENLSARLSVLSGEYVQDNRWVHFLSGLAAFLLENYEKTVNDLEIYIGAHPDNFDAVRLLARSHLKIGERREAMKLLDLYQKEVLQVPDLAFLQCDLYIEVNRAFKCLEIHSEVAKLSPDSPKLAISKAKLQLHRKDLAGAIELLENRFKQQNNTLIANYLGQLYLLNNQNQAALLLADFVLESENDNHDAVNLKSAALIKLKRYIEAEVALTMLLKEAPQHAGAQFNLASVMLLKNRTEEAKKQLKALINQDSSNVNARILLAETELKTGNPLLSIDMLTAMLEENKNNLKARHLLVNVLKTTGHFNQALDILESTPDYQKNTPEHYEKSAQLLTLLGNQEKASKHYGLLFNFWSEQPAKLVELAKLQRLARDLEGARKSLNKALTEAPRMLGAHIENVRLSIAENNLKTAQETLNTLKAQFETHHALEVLQGDILLAQRKLLFAQKAYLSGIKLATEKGVTDGLTLSKSYNLALKNIDPSGFEQATMAALEKQPDNFFVRNLLADFLLIQKRMSEAREHYQRLVKLDGIVNKPNILNNLALSYVDEDLNKAMDYVKKALSLNETSPAFLDTYGWVLVKMAKYEEGLSILRKANAIDAFNPAIRYHVAFTLFKLGRSEAAKRELASLLNSQEEFPEKKEAEALLASI